MEEKNEVIFVDVIQSVGVHNGVARIKFARLGTDGKPVASLELLVPTRQVKSIIEGLNKVVG
jgi:hypothetical protein